MAPASSRVWSRCANCQRCEWNDNLLKCSLACPHCGKQLKLFKAKPPKGGNNKVATFAESEDGTIFVQEGEGRGGSRSRGSSPKPPWVVPD
eukprot:6696822-Pyramimonas_sp.AAC.1